MFVGRILMTVLLPLTCCIYQWQSHDCYNRQELVQNMYNDMSTVAFLYNIHMSTVMLMNVLTNISVWAPLNLKYLLAFSVQLYMLTACGCSISQIVGDIAMLKTWNTYISY